MSDVIRLITPRDRAEAEEREYADAAHAEAIAMLERALAFVRDRKVASVAIVFALDDGSYGHLLPEVGNRIGHLIGGLADAQFNILRNTSE